MREREREKERGAGGNLSSDLELNELNHMLANLHEWSELK